MEEARIATGIQEKTKLLHEGLRALLEKQARNHLIQAKGSSSKSLKAPTRRRFD
ncbi:MAG: type II toxin-antitoxin system VapB family antitoxin [Micrococcales bacterium]|nr:type II toxin-antitoxin system VapB family antitoxin [Micrococcales bacterium]